MSDTGVGAATPAAESSPSKEERDRAQLVDLWKETEKVCMHFNDLLLNFRLKAIAGITLIAAGAATLFGPSGKSNFGALFFASLILIFIWFGIWLLDFRYYQRLLKGAVREAVRLEKELKGLVKLSSEIEAGFNEAGCARKWLIKKRWVKDKPFSTGRWAFYVFPMIALVAIAGYAVTQMWNANAEAPPSASSAPPCFVPCLPSVAPPTPAPAAPPPSTAQPRSPATAPSQAPVRPDR